MENLREGFRFRPSDAEALTFLLRFIAGQVMNDSGFITTNVDTYGKQEPWEVYTYGVPCGGDDWDCTDQYRFFITKLKKRDESRYSRDVGNKGTWKQRDKAKPVRKGGGPVIGFKKNMCYVNKGYDPKNGNWLMKEYELSSTVLEKFDDDCRCYVLCALKKRSSKATMVLDNVSEEARSNYLCRNLEREKPAFLKFQESADAAAVESTSTTNLCRNLECKTPAFLKFQESGHEAAVESTSTTNLCRNLERETPTFLKFQESTMETTSTSNLCRNLECKSPAILKFKESSSATNYDAGDYDVQSNSVPKDASELHQQIKKDLEVGDDARDHSQSNSVPGLDACELCQQVNKDLEVVGGMFHDMHEDEDVNFLAESLLASYSIEATSMLSFDHEYLSDLNPWDILLEPDDINQILHGNRGAANGSGSKTTQGIS